MLSMIIIAAILIILLSPLILAILILLAPLRFGTIVEYSDAGLRLWAKVTFLKIQILGNDIKPKKENKSKKKKEDKEKSFDISTIKPGSFSEFIEILRTAGNVLNRLRRRLLIKQLTLHYTSAGENAANTAMQFGAASAVFETIVPKLKRNFRIKQLDLRAAADFTSTSQKIYAKLNISIAVWEVIYIAFALLPFIISIFKKIPKVEDTEAKENDENINKDTHNDKKRKDGNIKNG